MTRTAPKLARPRREIAVATPNVLRVLPPSAETKESGGGIKMWARLESKSYLEAFEEIFSIEEKRLIDLISNNPHWDRMRHTNSWDEAPWISAFIDVDKIGKDA